MGEKILFFTLFFIAFTVKGFTQSLPEIRFSKETHQFGEVKEENGPIKHRFTFTNTGDTPLKISNVKASCGCTTPGWSKDEILPGKIGFIEVQYNPLNRPGPFKKSLTVTSNTRVKRSMLYIEGNVIPRIKTPEEAYPVVSGSLRMKSKTFYIGKVVTKGAVTRIYEVFNNGEKEISFQKTIAPKHIEINIMPDTLAPGEVARVFVTYDPIAKKDLGYSVDQIVISTNDELEPEKEFNVMATIEEYFPPMRAEELLQAPKISIDRMLHDFGEVQQGKEVKAQFTIQNAGKSDLNIRKIIPNCECIVYELEKSDLTPGGTTLLTLTFNPQERKGTHQKQLTIYSNDPRGSVQVLTIKARMKY